MVELVLHHYPLSFFAEKIRRILAYKNVPWRSVEQPMLAPKPDLTPLTGGIRRIPVLQIGADVYVDTACIARRLERLHPAPACIPAADAHLIGIIEDWADHRLASQVAPPVIVALLPHLPAGALADREKMSPTFSERNLRAAAPHALGQTLASLDRLDGQLRGRRCLLGDDFTLADAACFHPLWFLRQAPSLSEAVSSRSNVAAWFDRITAFGPGRGADMTPAEALAVARTAEPADVGDTPHAAIAGISPGDRVVVTADDYGTEECRGTVLRMTTDELVIARTDPTVGDIAVHFPRLGYRVVPHG